jgi:hypothetical protein
MGYCLIDGYPSAIDNRGSDLRARLRKVVFAAGLAATGQIRRCAHGERSHIRAQMGSGLRRMGIQTISTALLRRRWCLSAMGCGLRNAGTMTRESRASPEAWRASFRMWSSASKRSIRTRVQGRPKLAGERRQEQERPEGYSTDLASAMLQEQLKSKSCCPFASPHLSYTNRRGRG